MKQLPSSYRDSDGYVFSYQGKVYRYVEPRYEPHYVHLMKSGLFMELRMKGRLVPHDEITYKPKFDLPGGRVLQPMQIPFINYPYEWSFNMWKDAAMLTLFIAKLALQKGMVLKDATPFNIQFLHGKPIFIDTLSFAIYEEGSPWFAYRQFCECFLAPMLLMHYCHPDTNRLFTVYPNGIPLDVLVNLLPTRSRFNLNAYLHIHLQSKISLGRKGKKQEAVKFPKQKLETLLLGLEAFVEKLSVKKARSTWDDYYTDSILGEAYLGEKTRMVKDFLKDIRFEKIIDLGANDGHFSFLFTGDHQSVTALDADGNCINNMYDKIRKNGIRNILPLLINFTAPSPAIGWNNAERDSINDRLRGDLILALALVHHLAIANNLPLTMIADWLKPMGQYLLIEFVPREDEKVQLLLQNRKDIFFNYDINAFREAFERHYEILREEKIGNTPRSLFLMKLK